VFLKNKGKKKRKIILKVKTKNENFILLHKLMKNKNDKPTKLALDPVNIYNNIIIEIYLYLFFEKRIKIKLTKKICACSNLSIPKVS